MQGQNGYVNGYVVIIFTHYIIFFVQGRVQGKVTWASLFVPVGRMQGRVQQ